MLSYTVLAFFKLLIHKVPSRENFYLVSVLLQNLSALFSSYYIAGKRAPSDRPRNWKGVNSKARIGELHFLESCIKLVFVLRMKIEKDMIRTSVKIKGNQGINWYGFWHLYMLPSGHSYLAETNCSFYFSCWFKCNSTSSSRISSRYKNLCDGTASVSRFFKRIRSDLSTVRRYRVRFGKVLND